MWGWNQIKKLFGTKLLFEILFLHFGLSLYIMRIMHNIPNFGMKIRLVSSLLQLIRIESWASILARNKMWIKKSGYQTTKGANRSRMVIFSVQPWLGWKMSTLVHHLIHLSFPNIFGKTFEIRFFLQLFLSSYGGRLGKPSDQDNVACKRNPHWDHMYHLQAGRGNIRSSSTFSLLWSHFNMEWVVS